MPFFVSSLTNIDREYLLTRLIQDESFAPVTAFNKGFKLYNSLEEARNVNEGEITSLELYSDRYTHFDPRIYSTLIPGTQGQHDFSYGGPAIELEINKERLVDGKVALGVCWVSYYNQYLDPITGNKFKVPDNLIQIYKEIQKEIKKRVVKRYCIVKKVKQGQLIFHPRAFWISTIALPDIMAGRSGLNLPADGWKSGTDFSITPQE